MRLVWFIGLSLCSSISLAQDSKIDQKPRITCAFPLALARGVPPKLVLRGLNLSDVTGVTIVGSDLKLEIVSKGKTAVPANYEAQRVGDSVAEIKSGTPLEVSAGTMQLVATSAAGSSPPYEIMVAMSEDLIEEKEPNDGFKTAQPIAIGMSIIGAIHEARNVDVFELQAEAGQRLTIIVRAAQVGSILDPILTLYDGTGQIVAGSDDADGRDPRIETVIKKSGSYYLSIQDAHDAGGPHFAYLLKVALSTSP